MTKRLRGWKKDIETGKAEVLEKSTEEPNPFATKLLSLWAHGKVSAVGIQELAQLSQLGGLAHEEVAALANSNQEMYIKQLCPSSTQCGEPIWFWGDCAMFRLEWCWELGKSSNLLATHYVFSSGPELPREMGKHVLHFGKQDILGWGREKKRWQAHWPSLAKRGQLEGQHYTMLCPRRRGWIPKQRLLNGVELGFDVKSISQFGQPYPDGSLSQVCHNRPDLGTLVALVGMVFWCLAKRQSSQ